MLRRSGFALGFNLYLESLAALHPLPYAENISYTLFWYHLSHQLGKFGHTCVGGRHRLMEALFRATSNCNAPFQLIYYVSRIGIETSIDFLSEKISLLLSQKYILVNISTKWR